MKLVTFGGCALHTLATLIVSLSVARADWDLEQPAKWIQMPDLDTTGMDVRDWKHSTKPVQSRTLADDWECRVTGNITNIHIWGSWRQDLLPDQGHTQVGFVLAIHADIPDPDGPGPLFSKPGNVLWQRTFAPGTGAYQWRIWQGGLHEGWYDPYQPYYQPDADYTCYQYNFPITEAPFFHQEGTTQEPKVYWLEVQAYYPTGTGPLYKEFGWKTSFQHWNDAAVWYNNNAAWGGPWNKLTYPSGHQQHGENVDLAFVIQGEEPPPPAQFDFGDAPDAEAGTGPGDYQTRLADNGAYHIIVPNAPFFDDGTFTDQPDPEADGQPHVLAKGDDNAGARPDDEDGVWIAVLTAGQEGLASVGVDDGLGGLGSGRAFVDGWIDFNGDGDWTDAHEQITTGLRFQGFGPPIFFPVPAGATPGRTFARFRISSSGASSSGALPPTGPADDGEVEDHEVWIESAEYDFGDAPDTGPGIGPGNYQTTQFDDGAYHKIVPNGPCFGIPPDAETDGQPDPNAKGDDLNGAAPDDEEGVAFSTLAAGQPASVTITVGVAGFVDAWVDFDGDGTWAGPAESIWSAPLPVGPKVVNFTVPAGATLGQTFARFRIHSGTSALAPIYGPADDGEVEDHQVWIEEPLNGFDFGDAPDWLLGTGPGDYQTWLADNGAYHIIVPNAPFFDDGTFTDQPDAENDGQPDPNAWGDDLWGAAPDDEDGVMFPGILTAGQPGTVTIGVDDGWGGMGAGGAYVDAWIDFNADGDWTDLNEQVWSGWLFQGVNLVYFNVPLGSAIGQTFARFRINSVGPLGPTGGPAADGEVEDHQVWIEEAPAEYDYGDAPESYPTLAAWGGACHVAIGPWLGDAADAPDSEIDGQPDPNALGDDNDGNDDEDGVSFPTLFAGQNADIVYEVSNVSGSAYVSGHIDWNADGDWDDSGETYAFWQTVSASGVYTNTIAVPLGAARGTTFARVRVSALSWYGPTGFVSDGEVEDYAVTIEERFDYGDAPALYPTLAAIGGACHVAIGPWLGDAADAPDSEIDGQPDPNALGDDNDANDDEDGVSFPTLFVGIPANVSFTVNGAVPWAYVEMWIDWDGSGSWEPGESSGGWFGNGPNSFAVVAPLSAVRGQTFARLRISSNGTSSPMGLAPDGEVEDYAVMIEERFDYGDAPAPYPTLAVWGGACHIVTGPSLGDYATPPDWEGNGQPDLDALGDDNAATDDENGVFFPNALVAGTVARVDLFVTNAIQSAYVEIWIDWHADGDWTTPGDYTWADWCPNGWNTALFVVPPVVPWGNSFARVRISSNGTSSPMGLAPNGEVEDYKIRLAALDFGDAPEDGTSYATTLARNGARHLQNGLLWMSPSVDAEFDGQPSAGADGDDLNGTDDEDGVTLPTFIRQDDSAAVTVNATAPCRLNAWVDFNADGDWLDAGEQIFADNALVAGANARTFAVPSNALAGSTYARFRISTAGGDGPAGLADDGEVEDYMIEVREKFPPTLGPKWRQPLDGTYGLDLHSWTAPHPQGAASVGPVVADDWWCDGRPINAIRWWGSYIQYGESSNTLQVTRPYAFRLSWYLDRPTNTLTGAFSRPGPLLKQTTVMLQDYGTPVQDYDRVSEQYACTVPLDFLGPAFAGQSEHKFEYNVVLKEPWLEKNTLAREGYKPPCSSNVYWLAIEAMYYAPPQMIANPWGWETTAQRFNWNDAAVIQTNTLAGPTGWRDMTYVPKVDPWRAATRHPYLGRPVNMAFAMLSEVVGRRATKWSQLPNMELGTDMPSWRYKDPQTQHPPWADQWLRADDFVSDGRRITDIHWWGSYIGWYEGLNDASEFNPAPLPQGVDRPLGFDLSWHAHDVAANAPGNLIKNVFVPIDRCHEMYYCTIPQTGHPEYASEHEYQYYVDLLDERLGLGPWYEQQGVRYWLNIQAVFADDFIPAPPERAGIDYPHEGWGWKISGIEPSLRLDRSVVSNYVTSVAWDASRLPAWHTWPGLMHDLAFELTTDQTDPNAAIAITSIQRATNALVRVTSTGTGWAGTQYLQRRSTLVGTPVWINVETNEAPFPPPYENIWLRAGSPVSNEFYRVLERNP